jgi:hypothetical protein
MIHDSIKEDSSRSFLAAVIVLLPTASQAAHAAACSSESAQGDLLELGSKLSCSQTKTFSLIPPH